MKSIIDKYWKIYLNPQSKEEEENFQPPITYVRVFEDGCKYASGIQSPEEFVCPVCKRTSYPDYGRCAFCGIKGVKE